MIITQKLIFLAFALILEADLSCLLSVDEEQARTCINDSILDTIPLFVPKFKIQIRAQQCPKGVTQDLQHNITFIP